MAYRGFSFGFGLSPWVQRLIIVNVVVFFLQSMYLPLTQYLAFAPQLVLQQPWTLLTYMFAHGGFMHLLFNMLGLFFFGPPLEARWGSQFFIKYYLVCGLGGAALSFVIPAAFNSSIIGASGAVFGIMLAFALNWPDAPIYIWGILPVKAKYLVGVLAMMSFFSTVQGVSDGVAHSAHLGGVVAGFVYLRMSRPGGAFAGLKRMMARRRLRVVETSESRAPVRTTTAAARGRSGEEDKLLDELDRVLEKISTQGMSSLTPQERKLLDEVSRRYRND